MSEATDRPTRTEKPQISKQIYMGVISSDSLSKNAWVHLFNSGLLYHGGTFWSYFGFLIFLRFPIISGELIRTLANENKKPDDIEYDRVSFYIDARLLILYGN